MSGKSISAAEFDARFDAGEDMGAYLETESARRVNGGSRRVNVDFPQWMVARLDAESARLGVTRQSLIRMWIAERLG
jgi:hypothetical protein